jgi:hypothetical protein
MDVNTAIMTAKQCRPIIDPMGQLPEFLKRLKRAEEANPRSISNDSSKKK